MLRRTFLHIFSSNDVVPAMSIFDPRKAPKADSQTPYLSKFGEEAIGVLLAHYGSVKPAKTLHGNRTNRETIITSDITT